MGDGEKRRWGDAPHTVAGKLVSLPVSLFPPLPICFSPLLRSIVFKEKSAGGLTWNFGVLLTKNAALVGHRIKTRDITGDNMQNKVTVRANLWGAMLVLAVLLGSVGPADAQGLLRLDLGGSWQLFREGSSDALPADVPGYVHLDLLAAKKIPDPFYRDNEKVVQWVGEANWIYRRSFEVPAVDSGGPLTRCANVDGTQWYLFAGDCITSINGQQITSVEEFIPAIRSLPGNVSFTCVSKGGSNYSFSTKLNPLH